MGDKQEVVRLRWPREEGASYNIPRDCLFMKFEQWTLVDLTVGPGGPLTRKSRTVT